MSWAELEWKDGLSHKVLSKISDIENKLERQQKEVKQKQFLCESLEAAFEKQKQKVEDEKHQIVLLKRENQSLGESCQKLESKLEKLSHEIKQKDAHITSLDGQLKSRSLQDKPKPFIPNDTPQPCNVDNNEMVSLRSALKKEMMKSSDLEIKVADLTAKIAYSNTRPSMPLKSPWATSLDSPTRPTFAQKPNPSMDDLLFGSPMLTQKMATPNLLNMSGAGDGTCLLTPSVNILPSMESKQLKIDLEESVSKCASLQTEINQLKSEVQNLKYKSSSDQKLVQSTEEKNLNLKRQLEESAQKFSDLECQFQKITKELNCQQHNAESTRLNLNKKLTDLEKQFKQELSRANEDALAIEKQLNCENTKLTQEITCLKNEAGRHEADLNKLRAENNKLSKDVKEKDNLMQSMESNMEEVESKYLKNEKNLEIFKNENANIKTKLDKVETESECMSKKNFALKQELESVQEKYRNEHEKLLEVQNECELLQNISNNNQTSHADMENIKQLLQKSEEEKVSNEATLKQKLQCIEELEAKISANANLKGNLDMRILELTSDLELAKINENEIFAKLETVNEELTTKKQLLADLTNKSEETDSEKTTMFENLKLVTCENEDLKERIEELVSNQSIVLEKVPTSTQTDEDLNKELCGLKQQVSNLEQDAIKRDELVKSLEIKIVELQQIVKQSEAEMSDKLDIINTLNSLILNKDNTIIELRESLDRLGKDLSQTIVKSEKFKEQLNIAETQCQEYKTTIDTVNENCSGLSQELEIAIEQKEENAKQLASLATEIESKMAHYEICVAEKDEAISNLQQLIKANQSENQNKIDTLSANLDVAQSDCEFVNEEVKLKDTELKTLQGKITTLENMLSIRNDEFIALELKFSNYQKRYILEDGDVQEMLQGKQKLEEQSGTTLEFNKKIEALEQIIMEKDKIIRNNGTELSKLSWEFDELTSEKHNLDEQFKKIQQELQLSEEKLQSEVTCLSKKLDESLCEIESFKIEIHEIQLTCNTKTELVDSLNMQISQLSNQITESSVALSMKNEAFEILSSESENKIACLQQNLNDKLLEKESFEKVLKLKDQEISKLQSNLEIVQMDLEDIDSDNVEKLTYAEQRNASLNEEVKTLKESMIILQNQTSQLENLCDRLKESLSAKEETLSLKQQQIDKLELQNTDLRKDFEKEKVDFVEELKLVKKTSKTFNEDFEKLKIELEAEHKAKEEMNVKFSAEIDTIKKLKSSLETECSKIQEALNDQETENENLQNLCDQYIQDNAQLRENEQCLEAHLESLMKRKHFLENEIEKQRKEIEELQCDIENSKQTTNNLKAKNAEMYADSQSIMSALCDKESRLYDLQMEKRNWEATQHNSLTTIAHLQDAKATYTAEIESLNIQLKESDELLKLTLSEKNKIIEDFEIRLNQKSLDCEVLQSECILLLEKFDLLQLECSEVKNANEDKLTIISDLKDDLETFQERYDELSAANNGLTTNNAALRLQLSEIEQKNEELKHIIGNLTSNVEDQIDEIAEINASDALDRATLMLALENKQNLCSVSSDKIDEIKNILTEKNKAFNKLEVEMIGVLKDCDNFKSETERLAQFASSVELKLREKIAENEFLDLQIEKLNQELESGKKSLIGVKNQLVEMENSHRKIVTDLENDKLSYQEKIQQLHSKIKELDEVYTELQKNISELTVSNSYLEKEILITNKANSEISQKLEQSELEVVKLNEYNSTLNIELDNCERTISTLEENLSKQVEMVTDLKNKETSLILQMEEIKEIYLQSSKEFLQQNDMLKDEINSVALVRDDLQLRLDESQNFNMITQGECTVLKHESDEMKQKLISIEKDNERLIKNSSEWESRCKELKKNITGLEEENQLYENKLTEVSNEVIELCLTIDELEMKISEFEDQEAELHAQAAILTGKNNLYVEKISLNDAELTTVKQMQRYYEQNCKTLQDEVEVITKEKSALAEKLMNEKLQLKNNVDAYILENNSLHDTISLLRDDANRVTGEYEKLEKKLGSVFDENNNLLQNCKQLQKTNDRLQSEIESTGICYQDKMETQESQITEKFSNEIELLKQQLSDNDDTIVNLNEKLHLKTTDISNLSNELANLKTQYENICNDLEAADDQHKSEVLQIDELCGSNNVLENCISELKEELKSYHEQLQLKEESLQAAMSDNASLQEHFQRKQLQIKNLSSQINSLKNELEVYKNFEKEYNDKISLSEQQYCTLTKELQEKNTENENISGKINSLQNELEEYIQVKKELNDKILSLGEQNEILSSKFQKNLKVKQAEIENLLNQINSLQMKLDEYMTLEQRLNDKIALYEEQCSNLSKNLESVTVANENLKLESENQVQMNTVLNENVALLKAELLGESNKANSKENVIISLQSEVKFLKRDLAEKVDTITLLKDEHANAITMEQQKLSELELRYEEQNKVELKLQTDLDSIVEEMSQKQTVIDKLIAEKDKLENVLQAEKRKFKETVKQLNEDKSLLKSQIDDGKQEFDTIKNLNNVLMKEKENYNFSISSIKDSLSKNDEELLNLQTERETINNKHSELCKELSNLKNLLSSNKATIDKLELENDAYLKTVNFAETTISDLKQDVSNKAKIITEAQNELKQSQEKFEKEISDLEKQLSKANDEILSKEEELSNVTEEYDEVLQGYQTKLKQLEAAKESTKDVLNKTMKENSVLNQKLKESDQLIENLNTEVNQGDEVRKQKVMIKNQYDDLALRHEKFKYEKDLISHKLYETEELLSLQVCENDVLQNKVESMTIATDELKSRFDMICAEKKALQSEFENLEKEKIIAEEAQQSLHSERKKLKETFEERERSLENEITKQHITLSEMESSAKEQEEKLEDFRHQIGALVKKNMDLENEIMNFSTKETMFEDKMMLVQQEVSEMKISIDNNEKEKESLLKTIEKFQIFEIENIKLHKSMEVLKGKLHSVMKTCRRKEEEVAEISMELEKYQKLSKKNNTPVVRGRRHGKYEATPTQLHPDNKSRRRSKSAARTPKKHLQFETDESAKENNHRRHHSGTESSEYEVEGLPQFVEKGFSNIPSGTKSPYIVRRQQLSPLVARKHDHNFARPYPVPTINVTKPSSASESEAEWKRKQSHQDVENNNENCKVQ